MKGLIIYTCMITWYSKQLHGIAKDYYFFVIGQENKTLKGLALADS